MNIPNIHPVDELAAIREEIRQMQDREAYLRQVLLQEGADLRGNQYQAVIKESTRETVDKAALIAELGRKAVEPFLKTSGVRSILLAEAPRKE